MANTATTDNADQKHYLECYTDDLNVGCLYRV
jgi:hypothetical protein